MKFTVIVPVYNVEKYLERCVKSILNQTFSDFELILVDDGSPDRCPQMCDDYAQADPRVRVIHKENGGPASARNLGIFAAKGEYICYVDGDDWIDSRLLETIYQKGIAEHSPDMVIFGIVKKFKHHDENILTDLPDGLYEKEQLRKLVYPHMMYDARKPFCNGLIFPAGCNKIYRRELLLEHHSRDERILMGEDDAVVYECVWFSEKIYICNQILYFYDQQNTESVGHLYDPNRFENNHLLTSYMESRLGGKDSILDQQINAFKVRWLIMAIFHEVKNGRPLNLSAAHIKKGITQTKVLQGITDRGLPPMARACLLLLRLRLYRVTLLVAAVVNKRREQR